MEQIIKEFTTTDVVVQNEDEFDALSNLNEGNEAVLSNLDDFLNGNGNDGNIIPEGVPNQKESNEMLVEKW